MAKQIIEQSADFISNATFEQDGSDLVMTDANGQSITVEGYFNQITDAPDLITADGARLSPDMVDAFLSPIHSGQYASNNSTMNDASPVGQVTETIGNATVTRADGTKISLEKGMPIFQGDVIETDAEGAVNILFADQTSFAVSEDARLSVDEFIYNAADQSGSTFFSMLKGAFVYTSGLIGKEDPGSVNIETPAGSIGIRGTVVMGTIDPTGDNSEITIIDGAVVVTNAGGTVELNDNFETARLSSYEAPPVYVGQMSPDQVQDAYQSLSNVTGQNYGDMGEGTQNNTQQQSGDTAESTASEGNGDAEPQQASEDAQSADNATNDNQPPEGDGDIEVLYLPPTNEDGTLADTHFGNDGTDAQADSSAQSTGSGETSEGTSTRPSATGGETGGEPPPYTPVEITGVVQNFDPGVGIKEFLEPGTVIGRIDTAGGEDVTFTITGNTGSTHINNTTNDTSGFGTLFDIDAGGNIIVQDTLGISYSANPSALTLQITAIDSEGNTDSTDFNVSIMNMGSGARGDTIIGDVTNNDASLLDSGTQNDIIFAGLGNDQIVSTSGGDDVLIGGGGNDILNHAAGTGSVTMIGGEGDDDLRSLSASGTDKMFGGAGNDSLAVNDSTYLNFQSLDGGAGFDTLILDGSAQVWDLQLSVHYQKIGHIEEIFLNGLSGTGPGWQIALNETSVLEMTDDMDTLKISGQSNGAQVTLNGFTDTGLDDGSYDIYTSGSATVLVEQGDVTVV